MYVDVSCSIEKNRVVTICYAETYGWKGEEENVVAGRRSIALDCDVQYTERFSCLTKTLLGYDVKSSNHFILL